MMACLQMLLKSELVAYLTNTHHKLPGVVGASGFNPNEMMQSMKDNRRTWKLSVMSWARTGGTAQHLGRLGVKGDAKDAGGAVKTETESKATLESKMDAMDAAASSGESPSMRAFKASPAYERFMKSEPTTEKCLQRWLDTEKWRRDEGINDILEREHPHFDTIKKVSRSCLSQSLLSVAPRPLCPFLPAFPILFSFVLLSFSGFVPHRKVLSPLLARSHEEQQVRVHRAAW